MNLNTMFKRAVDRPIEGVIKADDQNSLRLEVEEYVLTNEIEEKLKAFIKAYNNYKGANGVWISGFFGSGKSHLLKMLALLLENRDLDGISVLNTFLPKCEHNKIFTGDLKQAAAIPSKSILFNIDQKADVISKTEIDALLAVFIKVFDESCGYYGKQAYIAQFERELDQDGLLIKFKEKFKEISSSDWETKGRQRVKRFSSSVDTAYEFVTGETVSNIMDKYRSDYRLSIEDFANQVNDYIEKQEPNFRLNFFVDEVGQYIAGNIKLMTNLQTIAESLATKSGGQAWVIVTAQEDMETVLGERSKQQSNDFSKIQARFANRLKLTSADVSEVIQKRLLMKNETGVNLLSDLFHQHENNFGALFDFVDGSQLYKNFTDPDHFIQCYPFIPYQFDLFQASIQRLSDHNAFEGKHSSVGERSMLGVFQQVAIQVGEHKTGQLASFDLMFEGIRSALKSGIQRTIIAAERQLDNKLAFKLLKALFLVKYIKEFKASIRNLSILMQDNLKQNTSELKKQVEEALNLLEQQTYIQRNGDFYEYLTDEEKDIEDEIKNTEIDQASVADELSKIIFDQVIKTKKIRFNKNGQDYPFTKKLDDRIYGREYELCIHIVSPFNEDSENEFVLQSRNVGLDEILAVLPSDSRLISDLLMYKKTQKYVSQNTSNTHSDIVKRILSEKSSQNNNRYSEILQRAEKLIGNATYYFNNRKLELAGENAQTKITNAFYELIRSVYRNLEMLDEKIYKESDVAKHLKYSEEGTFHNEAISLSSAEQELFQTIQRNQKEGIRTSLKKLIEIFEHKPYGWYYAAILCLVARLCAYGKVEVKFEGNIIENSELNRLLLNTRSQANIILEPQVTFTAGQIRDLKEFNKEFFDELAEANEAKALGLETAELFKKLSEKLTTLISQIDSYPFLTALKPVLAKVQECQGNPYAWYLTKLSDCEDDLLDLKEDILEPILAFMKGSQKDIFDAARKFIEKQQPNLEGFENEEAGKIKDILSAPDCYLGDKTRVLKSLHGQLKEKIDLKISIEKAKAEEIISELQTKTLNMDEFLRLTKAQQEELKSAFDTALKSFANQELIAVIRDNLTRFKEGKYQDLLSKIIIWNQPKPENKPEPNVQETKDSKDSAIVAEPKETTKPKQEIKSISSKDIKVEFDKPWLTDEEDLDTYLNSMRNAMLKQISEGRRILI